MQGDLQLRCATLSSCKGYLHEPAFAHLVLMSSLQVCKVTCCGIANFEQHCSSKRHLRKAALEAASITAAAAGAAGGRPAAPPEHRGTTYMGRQAQCRTYCKQVSCTEVCPCPYQAQHSTCIKLPHAKVSASRQGPSLMRCFFQQATA